MCFYVNSFQYCKIFHYKIVQNQRTLYIKFVIARHFAEAIQTFQSFISLRSGLLRHFVPRNDGMCNAFGGKSPHLSKISVYDTTTLASKHCLSPDLIFSLLPHKLKLRYTLSRKWLSGSSFNLHSLVFACLVTIPSPPHRTMCEFGRAPLTKGSHIKDNQICYIVSFI